MSSLYPDMRNVHVVNLPAEYRQPWEAMVQQWSDKLDRNLLRSKYYNGKNRIKNLAIAVPNSLSNISEVVGWPQKAVDVLAARVQFDGFVTTGDDRDPLGLDTILDENNFAVELSEAVRSALTHSCAFLNIFQTENYDGLDSGICVQFRSALWETGIWSWQKRGLDYALAVTDTDNARQVVDDQMIPTELIMYTPDETLKIDRADDGSYEVTESVRNPLGHVPVYPITYHQDLERPFGRSRISREVMSLTDTAMRTMLRMEVSAEFYSSPQRYLIGLDESPVDKNGKPLTAWEASISKMLNLTRGENGEMPQVGQFAQMTMQPHADMLRTLAGRMSGATGVPMSQLGVMTDSGPSSADAIAAQESELVVEARDACRSIGMQLKRAARDIAVLNGTPKDDPQLAALSVNWRDPERPSQAAVSDAVTKQIQAIPWLADSTVTLEKLGYTDSDITRLLSDKRRQESRDTLATLLTASSGQSRTESMEESDGGQADDGGRGPSPQVAAGGGQTSQEGPGQDLAADRGASADAAA